MTTEQVLMCSLKSTGDLTRGRGVTPSVLAKWVHAMSATSRIIRAVESFCGVTSAASGQHTDLCETRQKPNHDDSNTMKPWLAVRNPFMQPTPQLTSTASGVFFADEVNCDQTLPVGKFSVEKMERKKFTDIHLQRWHNMKSLATVTKSVKIKDKCVTIHPDQLFHRIICI